MAKSSKKVMLGPNALSFTDQSTGISIARGEVVELSAVQLRTPRIRKALNQGHLQYSIGEEPKYSDDDIKRFVERLRKQHGKGMEPSKVAKSYSLEEMKNPALLLTRKTPQKLWLLQSSKTSTQKLRTSKHHSK